MPPKKRRWYTADRFTLSGRVYHYIGSRKTKAGALKLVARERTKAGDVPLVYKTKRVGGKFRVYVATKTAW